ncbi:MAG: amino acid ABC transporter ATP-binding protein [Sphaerochaetaceae bacterium]
MNKNEKIIEVKNLQKSFDGITVLKGVDFSVYKGQVLSIIGSSGSGKSTILRCINQLETIDEGEITICNDKLYYYDENGNAKSADEKERKKINLNCGLVFQNFNLFPHFSVLKNVSDPQVQVLKLTRKEADENAFTLLEKVGLLDKKDNFPCQLSGGQKQRVSIARALALKPSLLCFDEPTSALDPELTFEILNIIKMLSKEDRTMIVVTHEMQFAKEISDEVIFLDSGMILERGKSSEIFNNPENERTKKFLMKFD